MTAPEHPACLPMPDAPYPPAPWRLRGDMYGAVLRLPRGAVPTDLLPEHIDIERRGGTVLAVAAWVDYASGSVLEYRELMVVAMTRITIPLTGTVLRIWVETRPSMEGGRQLWRIPKKLADFSFDHGRGFTGAMTVGGREQASYRFEPRFTLPVRLPSKMVVRQSSGTGLRRTVSSMRGRLQVGHGELSIPDDSELAFLNSGSAITHMAMRGFEARFGLRSVDLPGDR